MKAKKRALKGFDRLKLFPVTANTADAYAVDEGFNVPNVQGMTQDVNSTSETIYADDVIYLENTSWLGLNTTITLADMTLEDMSLLGFGTYDQATETLEWNPQGESKEFAATFRALMASGEYRMFRMYSFMVTEVRPTGLNTKGEGTGISAYQIIGMFTGRKVDGSPGAIHDGKETAWLDTVPGV
jgi:hypothetical protein